MNSKIVGSPDYAYANEEVGCIFRFGLSFLARGLFRACLGFLLFCCWPSLFPIGFSSLPLALLFQLSSMARS